MSLFSKPHKPVQLQSGRRRPLASEQSAKQTQAFSYYTKRSTTQTNTGRGQTDRTSEANRPMHLTVSKPLTILGATVLLAGVLYTLSLTGSPKVVTQTSDGNSYFLQQPEVYRQSVARSLASSPFNRGKLTIDTAKVSKDLTDNYPEIHTAKVTVPFFGRQPIVHLQPYRPSFILTTLDSAAYLLDENGRAVVSTSQITDDGELAVPTVQDRSGLDVNLGSQVLSGATVRFISEVSAILAASQIRYSALVLPPTSSELDVYIADTPYFVKLDLQGDARLQTGRFIAAKIRLEKEGATPGQYIDVRVQDRVYYR